MMLAPRPNTPAKPLLAFARDVDHRPALDAVAPPGRTRGDPARPIDSQEALAAAGVTEDEGEGVAFEHAAKEPLRRAGFDLVGTRQPDPWWRRRQCRRD